MRSQLRLWNSELGWRLSLSADVFRSQIPGSIFKFESNSLYAISNLACNYTWQTWFWFKFKFKCRFEFETTFRFQFRLQYYAQQTQSLPEHWQVMGLGAKIWSLLVSLSPAHCASTRLRFPTATMTTTATAANELLTIFHKRKCKVRGFHFQKSISRLNLLLDLVQPFWKVNLMTVG